MRSVIGVVGVVVVLALTAAALFWPTRPASAPAERQVVATIAPVAAILRPIVGDRAEVVTLLRPNASPHTYDPRPGDVSTAEQALAVFFAAAEADGWAAKLPAKARVELFALLPEDARRPMPVGSHEGHHHGPGETCSAGGIDPHFWTDPLTVSQILLPLAERLGQLDPDGRETYLANARAFAGELAALDTELRDTLAPVRGEAVFLYHPSLLYFLARYELEYGGAVEEFPGKEPSPSYLTNLLRRLRETNARAIFTEPQLTRGPAEVIQQELAAEDYEIRVGVLDPIGGVEGRRTYADLLRYNARVLRDTLQ